MSYDGSVWMACFRSFSAVSYRLLRNDSAPRFASSMALMRSWLQTKPSQAGSTAPISRRTAKGENRKDFLPDFLLVFSLTWFIAYSPPPAGGRTNGYDTMTIPPPSGFGNSQRRTACTVQFSTLALPIVEFWRTEAMTWPEAAMENWTMMRQPKIDFMVCFCLLLFFFSLLW